MISLESLGVYALCHVGGEPSLHPALVRLPLEFSTYRGSLIQETCGHLGAESPVEGEQDGCVAGTLRRGWESQSWQSGEGTVKGEFLALATDIY